MEHPDDANAFWLNTIEDQIAPNWKVSKANGNVIPRASQSRGIGKNPEPRFNSGHEAISRLDIVGRDVMPDFL